MSAREIENKNTIKSRDENILSLGEKLEKKDKQVGDAYLEIKTINNEKDKLQEEIFALHNEKNKLEKEKSDEIERLGNTISEEKAKFKTEIKKFENDKERLERQIEMLRIDSNTKQKVNLDERKKLEDILQGKEHRIEELIKTGDETVENMTSDIRKQSEAHADEIHRLEKKEITLIQKLQSTENRLKQEENKSQGKETEIKRLNSEKMELTKQTK